MLATVKARVVAVKPRGDGTFGVTLGPGPEIFWIRSSKPPKLGELAVIKDASQRRFSIPGGAVTLLEGGSVSVEPDSYTRRVVAKEWVSRVHQMVRRVLYPFQMEGAGWLASRLSVGQGCILGDDPGLGKTIQVLSALVASRSIPAIIISPPAVKRSWMREAKHLAVKLKVEIVNHLSGPIPSAHLVILSYELMRTREKQLKELGSKCIVFDEAHLLKEPTPGRDHRANVATRLAHHIGRSVLLTGTPMLNRPEEIWRLLHIIDPNEWDDFSEMRHRYCTSPKGKGEISGASIVTSHGQARNIEELQARVGPYMLRRLKEDVLKDQLPPTSRRQLLIDLLDKDRKSYDEADRDVVSWLRKVSTDERAMNAARNQILVKLNMLRRIAAVGKVRCAFKEYITGWFRSQRRPLVIFAYHRQVLDAIRRICQRLKIRVSWIKGSYNERRRRVAIDMFQGGKADVFIAPIMSAGVGINLHRASDILCIERLWTPSLMNQAESRCHRLGQKRVVTITYMDARNTVDEHIARVLLSKQRIIDKVVDDKIIDRSKIRSETIDEVIASMRSSARLYI